MSQSLFYFYLFFLYFLGSDSGTHVGKAAPASLLFPLLSLAWKRVSSHTHPPKVGTDRKGSYVCVCYRGQNTVLSGSQRVPSLGVRSKGQRDRQSRLRSCSGSSRGGGGGGGRAGPHLLASVEVMVATEARPLLGRVNKTDGPRPGMIKDETWIHLHQS